MMLIKADSIFFPGKGFERGKSLLIRGETLQRVMNSFDAPRDVEVLDFAGLFLSPMFCDHHLHFSGDHLTGANVIARDLLKSGIGTVFEGGDSNRSGLQMRKILTEYLDIKTSGCALHKKGTYGRVIGKGVQDFSEAKSLIAQLHALGVNYLKVINSGILVPELGTISAGGFKKDQLKEIIAYAKGMGLPVWCHANGDRAIRDAVDAGASAIIHGFSVSDETLSVMADEEVKFIPTVVAFYRLAKVNDDPDVMKRVKRLADEHLAAVKRAYDRGVRVLPGSDSGPTILPYGTSYREELELFRKAGLTIEDILSSAVTARLTEDTKANFLVLDNLSVEKVFFRGACYASEGPSVRNNQPAS
jgi:dihydroorotase-like cyclic amidohydrolase